MLTKLNTGYDGAEVFVNPDNINFIYGDPSNSANSLIEMAGYGENQAIKVVGTPSKVAEQLNGEDPSNIRFMREILRDILLALPEETTDYKWDEVRRLARQGLGLLT